MQVSEKYMALARAVLDGEKALLGSWAESVAAAAPILLREPVLRRSTATGGQQAVILVNYPPSLLEARYSAQIVLLGLPADQSPLLRQHCFRCLLGAAVASSQKPAMWSVVGRAVHASRPPPGNSSKVMLGYHLSRCMFSIQSATRLWAHASARALLPRR